MSHRIQYVSESGRVHDLTRFHLYLTPPGPCTDLEVHIKGPDNPYRGVVWYYKSSFGCEEAMPTSEIDGAFVSFAHDTIDCLSQLSAPLGHPFLLEAGIVPSMEYRQTLTERFIGESGQWPPLGPTKSLSYRPISCAPS